MLKNRIHKLAVAAALTALLASCASEDIVNPTPDPVIGEGNVTLTFTNSRHASRSASDESLNENLIKKLDIFLYTNDAGDNEQPVASQSVNINTLTFQKTTVKMSLTKTQTDDLFNGSTDGATCRMVAIANRPDDVILPTDLSVQSLRNLEVTSAFATQDGNSGQPSFVMFGDTDEERTGNSAVKYAEADFGGTASGNVMLVRTAARIALTAMVREQVDVTQESDDGDSEIVGSWIPLTNDMQVILSNGVENSTLDPSTATVEVEKSYFSISQSANSGFQFYEDANQSANSYLAMIAKMPFYTYPNQWSIDPTEIRRTTMTLIVPWRKINADGTPSNTYRTCYYKVPVTRYTEPELVRNTAYKVQVNVDMLGSFTPEENLPELTATYVTVDWADVESDVDIKDYRYLVVNQKEYVVNNASTISIPFYTSHPVEVSEITMTYNRFNMVRYLRNGNYFGTGEVFPIDITVAQNNLTGENNNGRKVFYYDITHDEQGNNILVLNHNLDSIWTPIDRSGDEVDMTGYSSSSEAKNAINNISYYRPTFAAVYSPYTFNVKIKHIDQPSGSAFEEELVVIQYPGMWIFADRNPYAGDGEPQTGHGNVWVNGYYGDSQNGLGNANGISSNANNRNPNMYVITINTLSNDQDYIIDDPRYFLPVNLQDDTYRVQTGTNIFGRPTYTTYYYLTGKENLYDNIKTPDAKDNNYKEHLAIAASWSTQTTALYKYNAEGTAVNRRRLSFYYPTNEGEDYSKVIAPKIRVASSYGVTSQIYRNNARRRCASYQEAGYPAGRWRIPTVGEMQFIITLSNQGKIPELFSAGSTYMSAQGAVTVPNSDPNKPVILTPNTSPSSTSSVRCVYDEWFWERLSDEYVRLPSPYDTFTWGDMPKANPEEGVSQ